MVLGLHLVVVLLMVFVGAFAALDWTKPVAPVEQEDPKELIASDEAEDPEVDLPSNDEDDCTAAAPDRALKPDTK